MAATAATTSGAAHRLRLLQLATTGSTLRRGAGWLAISGRHAASASSAATQSQPLARRLSVLASSLAQRSPDARAHLVFALQRGAGSGSSNSSSSWSALLSRRALSTLPTGKRRDDEDSDDAAQRAEQQRRDDETARTIKAKLAADIEKARNLALHQVVNVPNVITFARILATPYLAFLIVDAQYEPAIALLAAAGVSDWLDGYIARTYRQESIVGSFLDPFADKLMVGALSLSMLWSGLLPWPLVALVFGRDVLLVAGTFYHRLRTKDAASAFFDTSDSGAFEVKPTLLSKANTALQIALFGFTLTHAAWQLPPDPAIHALFGIVGATTFASGSEYLWSYINQTGAFRPIAKKQAPPPSERDDESASKRQ